MGVKQRRPGDWRERATAAARVLSSHHTPPGVRGWLLDVRHDSTCPRRDGEGEGTCNCLASIKVVPLPAPWPLEAS